MAPGRKPQQPKHAEKVKRIMDLVRADLSTRAHLAEDEFNRFIKVLTDNGYPSPPIGTTKERYAVFKFLQTLGRVEWYSGRHGRWVVPESAVPLPNLPESILNQFASLPPAQLDLLVRAAAKANEQPK